MGTNKKKWPKRACAGLGLFVGIVLLVCGILVLLHFRDFVDNIIKSEITLREGSQIAQVWAKPPVRPQLKLYFFNMTNPRRFLKGAKPVLQEVGPFVYDEEWEKVNVTWLDDGAQVEYSQKKTYFFNRQQSVGDEEMVLTLPNVPMLTAITTLEFASKVLRSVLGTTFEVLHQKPFAKLSIKDIMWGYENPLVKIGNDILPEEQRLPSNKFGLLVGKNGSAETILRVKTGKGNIQDVGSITAWNNQSKLPMWNGESCNAIKGTDGSIFHPELSRNETLFIFNRDLCQSLPLVFQKEVTVDGLPGYRFVPPSDVFARPEDNPDNSCFCFTKDGCNTPSGLFNMSACQYNAPIMLSWPHFFQADPKVLEAVEGLKPVPEKHQFYLDIQPKLGSGLRASARSQINVVMKATDQVEGLRDIILPIVWVSDGIESIGDPGTIGLISTAVHTPEKARNALYPACFAIGSLILLAVFLCAAYQRWSNSKERIANISPHNVTEVETGGVELKVHQNGQQSINKKVNNGH